MEGILFIIFFFVLLPKLLEIGKNKKKIEAEKKKGAAASPAQRQSPTVQLNRPAPAMKRRTPTVGHAAQREFSAPEAPCIVCENTGEDHFLRDKARRIAQLDDWLKNGLIDRDEYRVLKDRYQRGI